MKSQSKVIFYILFFEYMLFNPLFSEPRLVPDSLFVQAGQERSLSQEEWIALALAASGEKGSELIRLQEEISSFIDKLPEKIMPEGKDKSDSEKLLRYLHENIFTRYSLYQTEIGKLWNTGLYNCVSSAVFFYLCGNSMGLSVGAVRTTDHAFCYVNTDSGSIDVETTSPYGVDPGKEFEIEFANSTGFAYVPPGNYHQRENISPRSLFGLILQNRISALQNRHDYESGIGLAVDRAAFDPSTEALDEREKAFGNYIAWLNGRREYIDGLNFLKEINRVYPSTEQSRDDLFESLVNNRVIELVQRKSFDEAEAFIDDSFISENLRSETLHTLKTDIVSRKLYDAVNYTNFTEARDLIDTAYQDSFISDRSRNELLVFSLNREINQIYKNDDGHKDAYFFYDSLDQEIKNIPGMDAIEKVVYKNFEYSFHNDFSIHYNSGDYAGAEKILRAGLEYFPGSNLLQKDLKLLP